MAKSDKKEITIMTLLANENPTESRKLIAEYNMPDARNFTDLEKKLEELYFVKHPERQSEIEAKLYELHPHKNWFLRLAKTDLQKFKKMEEKSGCNGEHFSGCDACKYKYNDISAKLGQSDSDEFEYASGKSKKGDSKDLANTEELKKSNEINKNVLVVSIAAVVAVSVIGVIIYKIKHK